MSKKKNQKIRRIKKPHKTESRIDEEKYFCLLSKQDQNKIKTEYLAFFSILTSTVNYGKLATLLFSAKSLWSDYKLGYWQNRIDW